VQREAAPLLVRWSNSARLHLLASSPCSSIGCQGIDRVRHCSARELCRTSPVFFS
jgi:hypothetical protein